MLRSPFGGKASRILVMEIPSLKDGKSAINTASLSASLQLYRGVSLVGEVFPVSRRLGLASHPRLLRDGYQATIFACHGQATTTITYSSSQRHLLRPASGEVAPTRCKRRG